MIMKARCRAGGGQLSRYLLTENEHQQAQVIDQRGSVMDNLRDTLRSWETAARALTKGEVPLYHMMVRLSPGEALHEAQWLQILDVAEEKLKLTDHPRVVVAHELDGERHLHIVYNRLDVERGILRNMGNDAKHWFDTCRDMEKEFGLRKLESKPRRERNGNAKTRSVEYRMAKEAGTSRDILCNLVKAAWDSSKTGREFQIQLERFGITMTYGDSRDYNVWHKGKRYDPVRLLEEVRTREFRAKMGIDPPRIGERDMDSSDGPTMRKAKNLTHDQLKPELGQGQQELPAVNRNGAPNPAHLPDGGAVPRRSESLSRDEAVKQVMPELAVPRPKWRRVRVPKAPRPRLRPKLYFGDPGI